MFFRTKSPRFLLTKYVMALSETKMNGRYFYLRKLRLSEGRRKLVFVMPSKSRFDVVNLVLKEK